MALLSGKTALVTGGGRGIGKAIVLDLAGHGADIIVSDIDETAAQETASLVQGTGRRSLAMKADVSRDQDVDALVKASIEAFGRIDILVNNAGITRDNLLMRMSEQEWDSVLSVNLKGAFLCTRHVVRGMMKQRSGKIINMASVVGVMGNAGQANYAASKAGLIGFTKSAARELASRNIQVNAVAPGFIETDMTGKLPEEVKQNYRTGIPAGRFGTTQDVAGVVLFLSSPASDYVTGQVIHVDGGLLM
ncbi:3-oxoacyl-[acyl-carrier-protein] reductase [bacterium]|nr:3-oxoacyl-[acyl-carrier-protein] reductase [bacterium]